MPRSPAGPLSRRAVSRSSPWAWIRPSGPERKNAFHSIASVEVATARKFSCRERPRPLTTHESSWWCRTRSRPTASAARSLRPAALLCCCGSTVAAAVRAHGVDQQHVHRSQSIRFMHMITASRISTPNHCPLRGAAASVGEGDLRVCLLSSSSTSSCCCARCWQRNGKHGTLVDTNYR